MRMKSNLLAMETPSRNFHGVVAVTMSASVREVESDLAVGYDGGGSRRGWAPVLQFRGRAGLVGTGGHGQIRVASARSRVTALTVRWAQGALSAKWSTVRRAERAMVAGMVNRRGLAVFAPAAEVTNPAGTASVSGSAPLRQLWEEFTCPFQGLDVVEDLVAAPP